MELGADRKALAKLGVALAVLVAIVYFQYFRGTAEPLPARPDPVIPAAAPAGTTSTEMSAQPPATRQRGGRFRPRVGGRGSDDPPDPLTADATLRTGLLERVRSIEVPSVERDIFNFGRPKPVAVAPPPEARQAQAVLDKAMAKKAQEPPKPAPKQAPPVAPVRPPDWKYFGLASQGDTAAKRAFLLDGEEILVGGQGSVLNGRYRIESIGLEAIVLADLEANQEFSLELEVPR